MNRLAPLLGKIQSDLLKKLHLIHAVSMVTRERGEPTLFWFGHFYFSADHRPQIDLLE